MKIKTKSWKQDAVSTFKGAPKRFKLGSTKTNGARRYAKGDEATSRNRRINLLSQCDLNSHQIAPLVGVSPARVRQILQGINERLYVVNFDQLQDIQQQAFITATEFMRAP